MAKPPKKTIDEGGNYVTVTPKTQREADLLNRQLERIQSFMPSQKHRVTPTKLAKRLVMEQAKRDSK
ncbi:hypothetical protein J8A01_22915 [Vibrio parahaemolyticus]|uniref:hypothetical protein n=1 Tax=Vibrio parahaemolyticus TaxID=670 RepID=UPI0013756185|nr:hypothetical protein [Vibrio parahaemolyticus]MCF9126219.1 hypothetical protein [Vibrio parahaemolyticus]NCM80903.1 hypothetical protein [Vibrio parahaemolyticus]